MRILGVDPGTHRAGIGIIDTSKNHQYKAVHFEVIKIPSKLSIDKRLLKLFTSLEEKIIKHRPDVIVIENLFYAKDIQAVVRIGEARACAMLAASKQGISVLEYMPTAVKKSVSGNGRASKEQMQYMVKKLLGLSETPKTDAADACRSRGAPPIS